MPSSYTNSLRLDLPTEGSYIDSWGDVVNNGITTLVDTAVAGTSTVTVTSTNHVVSYANGATDEARSAVLILSGTPGAAFNIFVPPVSKVYIIKNDVATYTGTIYCSTVAGNTTPAGTGIAIPTGKSVYIRTDGTNFVQAITGGLTSGTSILYGDGSGGFSNVTIGSGLTFSAGTLNSSGTGPASSVVTTNFTIEESGGKLVFKYGATTVASLTSAGVFTALSDIVANNTP